MHSTNDGVCDCDSLIVCFIPSVIGPEQNCTSATYHSVTHVTMSRHMIMMIVLLLKCGHGIVNISTGNLLMRGVPPQEEGYPSRGGPGAPLKSVLFTLHHDLQKKEP